MTDIVYVLGDGAAGIDDRPLRWSLRSLAKHAANVGRVIVAGRVPAWLSDDVVKIPTDNTKRPGRKAWNILYGIKAAIEGAGLTAPFLYSSDDHYFLPKADGSAHDLDLWPRYYSTTQRANGQLKSYRQYVKRGRMPTLYALSLAKTRAALERAGLSTRRACLHLNTWMDPQDVASAVAFAEARAGLSRFGFEATCLVSAMFEKRMADAGEKPVWTPYPYDTKVHVALDCQMKLDAHRPQMSTSPKAERDAGVVEWMDTFYAEPCGYEKPAAEADGGSSEEVQ